VSACARGQGGSTSARPLIQRGIPVTDEQIIEEAPNLRLEATLRGNRISISNRDAFDWEECNVQINTELRTLEPWEHPILDLVPAGSSKALFLSGFEREELGGRFVSLDPQTAEEFPWKRLILHCLTPKGSASGGVDFGPPPHEGPPYGPGAEIGRPYEYDLYTHCGILGAEFDGREWDATPPLTNGSGNPPEGWGNPSDHGTMTLLAENVAEFKSDGGLVARFRPRKPGAPEPSECF
jgi:hypothetical protein